MYTNIYLYRQIFQQMYKFIWSLKSENRQILVFFVFDNFCWILKISAKKLFKFVKIFQNLTSVLWTRFANFGKNLWQCTSVDKFANYWKIYQFIFCQCNNKKCPGKLWNCVATGVEKKSCDHIAQRNFRLFPLWANVVPFFHPTCNCIPGERFNSK